VPAGRGCPLTRRPWYATYIAKLQSDGSLLPFCDENDTIVVIHPSCRYR
jgi:hypothetical protein